MAVQCAMNHVGRPNWREAIRPLRRHVSGLRRDLLDFCCPPHCPACGVLGEAGRRGGGLCPACEAELAWLPGGGAVCWRCGEPRAAIAATQAKRTVRGRAAVCPRPHRFVAGLRFLQSAFRYAGTGGTVVRRLKFSRDPAALRWSGRVLSSVLASVIEQQELENAWIVLVPVPMSGRKRRLRGFDHARALAREVARRRGVACRPELLRRVRDTKPQGDPLVTSRRANVAGAFRSSPRIDLRRDPATLYVLVDDVVTSASTLRACARALHRGVAMGMDDGAESGRTSRGVRIGAVTLARAVPPLR